MTYVMSDIHGSLRRFLSVLEQIDLGADDTLYVLGDVVDRHPYGITILREIMGMSNARMLLGNHEYMLLNCWTPGVRGQEYMDALALWYLNGGEETNKVLETIDAKERDSILSFLKSLPLNIDITVNGKQYKLIHASPVEWKRDGDYYLDEREFAVWNRLDTVKKIDEDYRIVFGHTPTNHFQTDQLLSIWYGEKRIGIDCGSGFPDDPDGWWRGRLSCLRLDDMREFYSEE